MNETKKTKTRGRNQATKNENNLSRPRPTSPQFTPLEKLKYKASLPSKYQKGEDGITAILHNCD